MWTEHYNVDWNDSTYNSFHVDTRDFNVSQSEDVYVHPDMSKLLRYSTFFFTADEVKALIERYFNESGKECEWRYVSLTNYDNGWSLKYLRIYRTATGFIICDSHNHALTKELLAGDIDQKMLHNN
jgi:hypothetical protein